MNENFSKDAPLVDENFSAPPSAATQKMLEEIHSSGRKQAFKLIAFLAVAGVVGSGVLLFAGYLPPGFFYPTLFVSIGGVYGIFKVLGLSPFED